MNLKNCVILAILFLIVLSCDKAKNELNPVQSKAVDRIGELKNYSVEDGQMILPKNALGIVTECATNGPDELCPNETATYTLNALSLSGTIIWSVVSGDLSIVGGQGTSTVTIAAGSSFSGGQISVAFKSPTCGAPMFRYIQKCNSGGLGSGSGSGGSACDYALGILDEYIDGTQSGANLVYLNAGGNFPAGTTYEWSIQRQDGTVQGYAPSTSNPRLISASINNRITRATVTARFGNCTKTVTKTFRCAIPNLDASGQLFPECYLPGGGGGIGFN